MNIHIPALQLKISEVVADYDKKLAAIDHNLAAFVAAGNALKMSVTIEGNHGDVRLDTGHVTEREMKEHLLKSAWKFMYDRLNIAMIASANDKRRFQQEMSSLPPFTLDNIRGTFGDFILKPEENILRGLAEVFCDLDQAYKSHNKVKIGTAGLPKRVIISNVNGFGSYGKDRLENVLNALAAYQGKPLVTWREISALLEDENALLNDGKLPGGRTWNEPMAIVGRGIRLRRFGNGNGHLFFEPATLRDINKALAAYYGDVLPDTTDEKPTQKKASTAVSKDLQYYPTPKEVVDRIVGNLYHVKDARVLEPSCGDGRIMDGLRKAGGKVFGIEVDATRCSIAKAKGHHVLCANFLEAVPTGDFDMVVMNPPFYGTHYEKHVRHALRFLKPGGTLVAILPASARYDHGLLDDLAKPTNTWSDSKWQDLPVGSFSESGTNINTVVLTLRAPE